MSDVTATIQRIADVLRTVDPAPEPPPMTVYKDPKAALSLGEFPCIVLSLSPQATHQIAFHGEGIGKHTYTLGIWVLLGTWALSSLPELHSRVLPWPSAIATALMTDITLGGTVDQIGDTSGGDGFFTYTIGQIKWATGDYFGLSIELGVQEKPAIAVG